MKFETATLPLGRLGAGPLVLKSRADSGEGRKAAPGTGAKALGIGGPLASLLSSQVSGMPLLRVPERKPT